ncbi:MAG TPA: hypothetical protein VF609_11830 [Flavisolibacter sp.]|jgi:hypothetical protein
MKNLSDSLFRENIEKGWWETISLLIHDGMLKEGSDFIILDGKFYLSFLTAHDAFVNYVMRKKLPREWLLSAKQMKKFLAEKPDFLDKTRKRFDRDTNIRCLVWRWNEQVRLPVRKLRKVS